MKDKIALGPSPYEEPGAQVGDEGYGLKARAECRAYIEQLTRCFTAAHGRGPRCELCVSSFNHDFGTYYEVCAKFDSSLKEEIEDAFWFDSNNPSHWDDIAKAALKQ